MLIATASVMAMAAPACAQAAAQPVFAIPAGPLADAIVTFSRQSGLQVTADAGLMNGRQASPVSGPHAPSEALGQLLAGTGLTYRFVGSRAIRLELAPQAQAGAIQLGPVRVEATTDESGAGSSSGDAGEAPYRTAGAVTHVSRETIDRFRGSSPADVFRGIPGVMSGEARNGAGSVDVNIRGMQGMGRVATTIDGAENEMMVYQGYQGLANRTFVDPDLIAGIDITRGSDASSHGIAGTVAMRTFNAEDIVKPGETFGIRLNLGFGGNTVTPHPRSLGGYMWQSPTRGTPDIQPIPSYDGIDRRPGFLDPTSGSASVVAAVKKDAFDLVFGYAHRKQGNYIAGTHGPSARPVDTGEKQLCFSSGFCYPLDSDLTYTHYYINGGISSYRAGEEVLNTQLETDSWIAKGTLRFGDGHALQLGYSGFRSEAGDILAANFQDVTSQARQEDQTAGTRVDTGTLRYHWKPSDNGLVDLKANLWLTSLRLRNPPRLASAGFGGVLPEDLDLPIDYRTSNVSRMWGGDVGNVSKLSLGGGSLRLDYGASYINEDTHPTKYTDDLNDIASRDGTHQEMGAYLKAAYQPLDWLTLGGGLRYSHYWSHDRAGPDENWPDDPLMNNAQLRRSAGGWSPSAGVTIEPVKDLQFYVNYSDAVRMPTLFESVKAYTILINPDLRPERSRNWEFGANLVRKGVFAADDKTMLKLDYFNWNVKDFVARQYTTFDDDYLDLTISGLQIYNIDRARFAGIEFSGQYDIGGFSAQLAANYYTNVEFCQTADTCANKTLSADYATNQVPPKYSVNLTLSQKLFDEKLTLGGRASFIGKRAAGHGQPVAGLLTLISVVNWKPYATADLFADYKLSRDLTLWTRVENVLDKYYVDPLGLVDYPAPGRTFRFGFTGDIGGPRSQRDASPVEALDDGPVDWSGFHLGAFSGYDFGRFHGRMTALDGSTAGYPGREAPHQTISGFSLGAAAGYDREVAGHIVIGVEADIARSEVAGSRITYADEGDACYDCTAGDTNLLRIRKPEAIFNSKIKWLSTLRGRLGYAASDKLMVYSTGGLAFLRQDEARTQYGYTDPQDILSRREPQRFFTERSAATRSGFVLGGGGEYALDRHWSVKADALFSWFGNRRMTFPDARAGVMPDTTKITVITPGTPDQLNFDDPSCFDNGFTGPGCFIPGKQPVTRTDTIKGSANEVVGRRMSSKLTMPMIRIGVNYRF